MALDRHHTRSRIHQIHFVTTHQKRRFQNRESTKNHYHRRKRGGGRDRCRPWGCCTRSGVHPTDPGISDSTQRTSRTLGHTATSNPGTDATSCTNGTRSNSNRANGTGRADPDCACTRTDDPDRSVAERASCTCCTHRSSHGASGTDRPDTSRADPD